MEQIKQTATDLMYERAISVLPMGSIDARKKLKETYQLAKEMEKQQHKETWFSSTLQFANESEMLYKKDFEQYFNEKFKNK